MNTFISKGPMALCKKRHTKAKKSACGGNNWES